MSHTLAQKYLIELLMWNVSNVQKTIQLNLTGLVERSEVKTHAKEIIQLVLMQRIHPQNDNGSSDCENRAQMKKEKTSWSTCRFLA